MRLGQMIRLLFPFFIFLAFMIPAVLAETPRNPSNTFFLGSHLCRVPQPEMSEMLADMEILKKQGFNLIKIQTHWIVDEPLEGQYDFSHYEKLIQRAGELGMDVYIGFTCEQAPMWLFAKYPSCRLVGRKGLPIIYETHSTLHSDGKPGPLLRSSRCDGSRLPTRRPWWNSYAEQKGIRTDAISHTQRAVDHLRNKPHQHIYKNR